MSDAEWMTRHLREIAKLTMGQSPPSETVHAVGDLQGLPFLQGNAEFGDPFPNAKYLCTRPLRTCSAADTLISVRAPVGETNKADRIYCIGRGLASISFRDLDPGYGWHAINGVSGNLRLVAQGTTFEAIGKRDLGNLGISFPPPHLQRMIAEILDTMDGVIYKTELHILKLEQAKQGLLQDLFTRGMNQAGKRQETGFNVTSKLDSLPRGWCMRTLGEVSKYVTYGFTNPMPTAADGPWMLTAADINYGYVEFARARHTTIQAFNRSLTSKSRPNPGDILITKDGTLGRVASLRVDGVCVNQSVAVVRPAEAEWSDYIVRYLLSPMGQDSMLSESGGSTIKHLYITKLAKLKIPFPPKGEARRIVEVVKQWESVQLLESDRLAKLRLLKQGLMDDLLTGRVRIGIRRE